MAIVMQSGILVLPQGPTKGDLRVEDGLIAAIGPGLDTEGAQVVDAEGKLVFPGVIDTHFEMSNGLVNETADDWVSCTKAALVGGTTCGSPPLRKGEDCAALWQAWQEDELHTIGTARPHAHSGGGLR